MDELNSEKIHCYDFLTESCSVRKYGFITKKMVQNACQSFIISKKKLSHTNSNHPRIFSVVNKFQN